MTLQDEEGLGPPSPSTAPGAPSPTRAFVDRQLGHLRTTPGTTHVRSLDLLRAFAVLGVFALHLVPFADELGVSIPLGRFGELGVSLFFVLSGYFIGFSVLSPPRFDGLDYTRRRAGRILPAYWFSLAFVILVQHPSVLTTAEGLADVGAHVFLVQGFFREYRTSLNPVLWTLTIEWFFYLFMLVIAGLWRRRIGSWMVVAAMVVGCLVYRSVVWSKYGGDPPEANFWIKQLPGQADLFAAGMLVALLVQSARVREAVGAGWVKVVGLVAGVAVIVASIAFYAQDQVPDYYRSYVHVVWWPLTFALGAALLVLFVQQFEHSIGWLAHRSGLAFVGLISYSVYLFHVPIISLYKSMWRRIEPPISGWLVLAGVIVAVLVFSTLVYLFVERPFMTWSHRSRGARRGGFALPAAGPPGLDDARPSEPVAVTE